MRIEGLRLKKVSEEIFGQAMENADSIMDDVVSAAKAKLRSTFPSPIVRKGGFTSAHVSFTPKTGRNKGQPVSFNTDKRWVGRHQTAIDMLAETIRRVNKPGSGNVRVYAGNIKAYWAFMAEKGTVNNPPANYLRGSFHPIKGNIVDRIKNGK